MLDTSRIIDTFVAGRGGYMAKADEQATAEIDVAANLAEVRRRIGEACAAAGRHPDEVTLVAVSKAQPVERIEAALAAGQRVFGENYVQEAAGRWPHLRERWPDVELHMIGALQSNKAAEAVRLFDVVQTVDRDKLARELQKSMAAQERARPVFVEVNLGEEPQKAGIHPDALDAFVRRCRDDLGLTVDGLMAIPPEDEDVALHAALLAKLARRNGLAKISIGMSSDYETAVRFGATHVRVGTGIFGPRLPRRQS
jgi:pyridoxal phosphate enzyme (YggS family)